MSQSANVRSIQAISDFKMSLATFAEDARNALSSSEMEIRRTRNWLSHDQMTYWMGQVKKRSEELSIARTELHRRKISQQGSDTVSDTEQKEAVRVAQRRLEEAEHKVKICKKWVPILEHAIAEYHATSQPLGDRLAGSLVNSLTLLERMVVTLQSYLAVQAQSTEVNMGKLAPAAAPAAAATGSAASAGKAAASADADEAPAAAASPADSPATTTTTETEPADAETVTTQTSRGPRP